MSAVRASSLHSLEKNPVDLMNEALGGREQSLAACVHLHAMFSHHVWWLPPVDPLETLGWQVWGRHPRHLISSAGWVKQFLERWRFGQPAPSSLNSLSSSVHVPRHIQSQRIWTRIWTCDHSQHPACLRPGGLHYSHLKVEIRKCGVNITKTHTKKPWSVLRIMIVGFPVRFPFLVE